MPEIPHRILLMEPPFYRLYKDSYSIALFPLSLGYLSGVILRETDWQAMAYNADFNPPGESIKVQYLTGEGHQNYLRTIKDPSEKIWEEIRSMIREYCPSVVGISSKTQNYASACMVAQLAKEVDEKITVIVGGPHASMVGTEILKCPHIDLGVRGEGEITIIEILSALEKGKGFRGIRGVFYREDGQEVVNDPREFITDLDTLPFPHQSAPKVLKDYDQYPVSAFMKVISIRGCPHNCQFCASREIWSRKPRFRSPANVISEIKSLQKLGVTLIRFDDDTFGVNKKYISDLCQALMEHCPGIRWDCEIHVTLVEDQIISLMKRAGCYQIQIGVESGNNQILREIRKNTTIEAALAASQTIKKHHIRVQAYFMVGFPQETEETLRDTVAAMKKIKCDLLEYSIFTPNPGTETFELCKAQGLIGDDYNVSLYGHQSPANHFCMNIPFERFRVLVSEIEKMVDRKNTLNRIKMIFSLSTLKKIQMYGIWNSLQKGIKLLSNK